MATSAAPTFFPVYGHVEDSRFIDGGVWANNPNVVGIAEALRVLDISLSDIRVLSLGTTDGGGWACLLVPIPVMLILLTDLAASIGLPKRAYSQPAPQ